MRDFRKPIKKSWRPFLFFFILLLLLNAASRAVSGIAKRSGELVRDRNRSYVAIQKEPENTVQVLVLGDSESYTTVSPMQLWKETGIPAFVCGQSGQKPQETYYMLKTALETQSPRVVLLETHALYNKEKKINAVQNVVREAGNYIFPVFRLHDIWKAGFSGKHYSGKSYKGFEIRAAVQPYKGGAYMKPTEEKEPVPEFSDFYLCRILELCRAHNAELVLYSGPSPVNYDYRRHNGLKEAAEEYSLAYVDLNLEEIGIDWDKDTLDKGDHLNIFGAQKVTSYLGKYLRENFGLEDLRNEEQYQSWNREAENFMEQYCKIVGNMG